MLQLGRLCGSHRQGPWWRWHVLEPVRCVQQFAVPCSSIRKGGWKLRKQLRQPHRSSRRATTHCNSSSTVGSSPGVVEKRILGVFSLRTSDDDYEQFFRDCGPPPMVGHLSHPALPIHSRMERRTHSCEVGAIRLPASLCAATRERAPARRVGKARRGHFRASGGRFMQDPENGLRRITLPRTSVINVLC